MKTFAFDAYEVASIAQPARTTKPYGHTGNSITLDEIERIAI